MEKLIISTINILDRYAKLYKEISEGRFEDYESYFSHGCFSDEEGLIKPKLWIDFLEKILGFPKDEYIPERHGITGKKPDFTPRDKRLHPFIFEIKGTDAQDLLSHYAQISQYIKPPIKWGVITNMRELLTFENVSAFANQNIVPDYSFSFLELYKNYKSHPKWILEFPNTKQFLAFVKRFKFQEVDFTKKIELIKEAEPWTGEETLDPDELINTIRKVTKLLIEDVQRHREVLCENLRFHPALKVNVGSEFEHIACEIDKKRVPHQVDNKTWEKFIYPQAGTLEYRALDIYFSRVAYFAMTRILLARLWEDIGFIDQSLYDGGFARWYENFNRQIDRVLRYAFGIAGEKYSWLYRTDNNYTWYTPSENTLIDVLYEFSNYNLGKLDTDVLGTVYEEYVDRVDRKNKGQYYTPREVIKLIWDRVGFTSDEAFFNYEDGKRSPKLIFDPVTGSGGFLVEAARRIRMEAHYNDKDFHDLNEIFFSIVNGLWGSEISVFAHYITEINLLIQLTPIIKKILATSKHLFDFPWALSTIPMDLLGLELEGSQWNNFMNNSRNRVADQVVTTPVPLGQFKTTIYNRLVECHEFDYVCGNPPYVGEKGHKELFQSTLSKFPYWKKYYQGKMDYLYFFIILGLKKLKEGGKLGFITTSYWPTADGASKLREYILNNALIHEIIDFGEIKIFEGAPGQHNIVFILEKCPSYLSEDRDDSKEIKANIEKKKHHKPKIVKVKKQPPPLPESSRLAPLIEHIEKHIYKKEYSDEYIDVFQSAVQQSELTEGAWNLEYSGDIAKVLSNIEKASTPISELCNIDCGIFSNADYLSEKYVELIPQERRNKLNIKSNDGIFILNEKEVAGLLKDDPDREIIKRTYKNSDIDSYFVDTESDRKYLLYIDDSFQKDKFPSIYRHLEKFKEVLMARVERYGEKYPWWRLHRPHNRSIYENPKIVTSRWGKQNVYAIQSGNFFENSDINLYVPKSNIKESLKYLLGLLNSRLLNYWVTYKGRGEGVSRQIRLKHIPIRRIDFDDPKEVKVHNEIVEKVDSIIKAKKELAEYNKFFSKVRLTKLGDRSGDLPPPVVLEPDAYAITKSLPSKEHRILRTHSQVRIEPVEVREFYFSRLGKIEESTPLFAKEREYSLELIGKGKKRTYIIATLPFVNYLKEVLANYKNKSMDEIKEILIPRDFTVYETKKKEIVNKVISLLTEVNKLQKQIDKKVYQLYGISDEEQKFIEGEI